MVGVLATRQTKSCETGTRGMLFGCILQSRLIVLGIQRIKAEFSHLISVVGFHVVLAKWQSSQLTC